MMEEHIKEAFHYTSFDVTILDTNIIKLFERNISDKVKYIKRKTIISFKINFRETKLKKLFWCIKISFYFKYPVSFTVISFMNDQKGLK